MSDAEKVHALSTADLLRQLASYTQWMGLPFTQPRLLSEEAARRAEDMVDDEAQRLRERLEDKSNSLRTEIAAKVTAYRDIAALEAGIREIIGICEQDARDQDHNGAGTSDKRSKAYAEGRGTACRGIAARLRALLPTDATTKEGSR